MKNYSTYILPTLLVLFVLLFPVISMAQGDPGGDPGVPFDGGASILIASGLAYGAKKYRERKQRNK